MNQPADFRLETSDLGQTAVLTGDWTAVRMGSANELLGAALKDSRGIAIDANGIDRCDTSGAYGILKAIEQSAERGRISARVEILRLLDLVARATAAPASSLGADDPGRSLTPEEARALLLDPTGERAP